ncbi:MAG: hypothetical protein PHY93_16470 [Bacteriovorax sp.]|nr:hypothetical protein [Bacteriovorax sp.]
MSDLSISADAFDWAPGRDINFSSMLFGSVDEKRIKVGRASNPQALDIKIVPDFPKSTFSITGEDFLDSEYTPSITMDDLLLLSDSVLDDVLDIFENCTIEGWDGYGAHPLNINSAIQGIDFILKLPRSVLSPELFVHTNGSFGTRFFKNNNSLILCFHDGGIASFAGIINDQEILGTFNFNSGEMPVHLLTIYEQISDERF